MRVYITGHRGMVGGAIVRQLPRSPESSFVKAITGNMAPITVL